MTYEELVIQAKEAKNVEELMLMAKEFGIKISEEDAKTFFEQLHKTGEMADEELENVAGGWCYHDGNRVVTAISPACKDWVCDECGSKSELLDDGSRICRNRMNHKGKYIFRSYCCNCKHYKYEDALSLCTYHRK